MPTRPGRTDWINGVCFCERSLSHLLLYCTRVRSVAQRTTLAPTARDDGSGFGPPPRPAELPLVLPAHADPIPRALAALPEAGRALPRRHAPVAEAAVLGPVVLLARAVPADHAVRPLGRVVLALRVAPVARVDLEAAAEAEPAVALGVMAAAAALGELRAGRQPERFPLAPGTRAGRRR